MGKPISAGRLTQWARRAQTLQIKATELYDAIRDGVGEDDNDLLPLIGDTLCSSAELRHTLQNRAILAGSRWWA